MRKLLLFFYFSIGVYFAHSQSKYSDYHSVDKVLIQNIEFGNSLSNWLVGNKDNFSTKVDDGFYKLSNAHKSMSKMVYSYLVFDEKQNFELSAKIKIINGPDSKYFGLLWGCSKTKDFGFYFNKNKSCKISKFDSVSTIMVKNICGNLNVNDLITLTIRKINLTYSFFINEEFLFQCDFQPFFGYYIGFLVPSKSELWIKSYQFNYIPFSAIQTHSDKEIQHLVCLRSYAGIDAKRYSPVFEEEFTDNLKLWNVGSGDSVNRLIENGYYTLQNASNEHYSSWNDIPFDHNTDFEIETSIKFDDGTDKSENCILWGSKDKYSYRFGFNGEGSIFIYKSVDGVFSKILNFTTCKPIIKNSYNKLTIRRFDTLYYFFVNENLIYFTKFEDFYGDRIGFVVSKKSSIRIENLKISRISN
ncbi:MAG: hypothetical protein WCP69_06220 [Bacteroidota bacterium]